MRNILIIAGIILGVIGLVLGTIALFNESFRIPVDTWVKCIMFSIYGLVTVLCFIFAFVGKDWKNAYLVFSIIFIVIGALSIINSIALKEAIGNNWFLPIGLLSSIISQIFAFLYRKTKNV